jgi:hypothetical protein
LFQVTQLNCRTSLVLIIPKSFTPKRHPIDSLKVSKLSNKNFSYFKLLRKVHTPTLNVWCAWRSSTIADGVHFVSKLQAAHDPGY